MSLNDTICAYLTEYFKDYDYLDVQRVVGFDEGMKSMGVCETCYYEYYAVDIYYEDSNGETKLYEYDGTLSGLLK